MNKKESKKDIKFCSNCNFSDPSFNLLYCSLKNEAKGYQDFCHCWEKKEKKKHKK